MAAIFRPLAMLTLMLAGLAAGASQAPFSGLRDMMTEEEFVGAGLDKLSPENLASLDAWIAAYSAGEAQQARQAVIEEQTPPKLIESRIKGEFLGWRGKTVFELENGQVWEQRVDGIYSANLTNPRVRITANFLGFYNMEVLDTGKKIGVKRVQ